MSTSQSVEQSLGKDIFFLSDAHLGTLVLGDVHTHERKITAFLDSIKHRAKAIYLMGDMLDFWFEYKRTVPKGFVRFLGKLAELSDSGVELHFFIGNHDLWTFGYLEQEIGMKVYRKPEVQTLYGKTLYLTHGDEIYANRLKHFKFIRSIFHNRACQWLFGMLPSAWGMGFGLAWSASNRKRHLQEENKYEGEQYELLVAFAKQRELTEHVDYYVFGHRHLMLDLMLATKSRVVILGDFLQQFSYAVLNEHGEMRLEQLPE